MLVYFEKDVCTDVVIKDQDDSKDLSPRLKYLLGSYHYIAGSKENVGGPIYVLKSKNPFMYGVSFLYYDEHDRKWRGTVKAV